MDIASRQFTFPEAKNTCTLLTRRLHIGVQISALVMLATLLPDRFCQGKASLWLQVSLSVGLRSCPVSMRCSLLTGVMASHVTQDRNGQEALSIIEAHEGDDLCGNSLPELPGHLSYLRLVMELSVV